MNSHARRSLMALLSLAILACNDSDGPAGPAEKALDFTLQATETGAGRRSTCQACIASRKRSSSI